MTVDQREQCHAIIHTAAIAAGGVGVGLAQLPLSDSALIIPIQISMIVGLGKVFDIHISDSAARGVTLGMAAMYLGRTLSQILVGWIPIFGNAINATTAAGITEAMGWAVVSKFEKDEIESG